jgi:hypothetical protein
MDFDDLKKFVIFGVVSDADSIATLRQNMVVLARHFFDRDDIIDPIEALMDANRALRAAHSAQEMKNVVAHLLPNAVGTVATTSTEESTITAQVTLAEAFDVDIVDRADFVSKFCDMLKERAASWKPVKFHSPYITLVQSSGFGKSRLIKEAGARLYSFQVCLRGSGQQGYPPRTPHAADFLTATGASVKHYMAFLAACLDTLALRGNMDPKEFLHLQMPSVSRSQPTTPEEPIKKELNASVAYDFWRDIVEKANSILKQMQNHPSTKPPSLQDYFNRAANSIVGKTTIFFSVDEARGLISDKSSGQSQIGPSQLFRNFRDALATLPKTHGSLSVIAIFLDTTSRVANFAPAMQRDPSLRPGGPGPTLLMPPIWLIPWWDRDRMITPYAHGMIELKLC